MGTKNYQNWLFLPIKPGRIKDEVLIRIFFLGDSNKQQQKDLITDYLTELSISKNELVHTQEQIKGKNLSQEDQEKTKFQLSTLQFGIDYIAFKQEWFQSLLTSL